MSSHDANAHGLDAALGSVHRSGKYEVARAGVRRMGRGRLALFVAAVSLVVPATGSASTAFVSNSAPGTAVFRAGGGEVNDLEVHPIFGGFEFFDAVGLLFAGPGCAASLGGGVECQGTQLVEASLRGANDTAHVVVNAQARIWAGPGDDNVVADSFAGSTFVFGEAGDDEIAAGGEGGQLADGGPGNDIVHAGGFAGSGTGLGGPGADVIDYRTFIGGGLATLDGGPGNDTIVSDPTNGTVDGGPGNDTITIDGLVPFLGGADGFTINGGPGADTIFGGLFGDTVNGGLGPDDIDVVDGGADIVSCGPGQDVVHYDAGDTIAADCEIQLSP